MGYAPIGLVGVPAPICDFVSNRVEPYLRDVRVMLATPLAPDEWSRYRPVRRMQRPAYLRRRNARDEPAMNLTIATSLCGVIGGLARVFYNDIPEDNQSFKATAARYPMEYEPHDAVGGQPFGEALYDFYRCSLVHSLGLNMQPTGQKAGTQKRKRYVVELADGRYVVARHQPAPRTERELQALDTPHGRLTGLQATMSRTPDKVRLDVDALYSGVRRLVRVLATDSARQAIAVSVLTPWTAAYGTISRDLSATQSSAPAVVSTADPYALRATGGPVRGGPETA